jgi:hypothetical protein
MSDIAFRNAVYALHALHAVALGETFERPPLHQTPYEGHNNKTSSPP